MSMMNKNKGPAKHRVTQKDIADALGLHQTAVSRVLNGTANVSPQTRERIYNLAAELGYRTNVSARTVRGGGQYHTIHYVCSIHPNFNADYWPIIHAAARTLQKYGYQLAISTIDYAKFTDDKFVSSLLQNIMADGLLMAYVGGDVPTNTLEIMRKHNLPVVWINSLKPEDCVCFADYEASLECTTALIAQGQKKIAYFNYGDLIDRPEHPCHYSSHQRYAGYADAMNMAGLPIIRYSRTNEYLSFPSGSEFLRHKLDADQVSALICYNEEMLQMATIAAAGLANGSKIALAGFVYNNLSFCGRDFIRIHLPLDNAGEVAAIFLLKIINGEIEHFSPRLIKLNLELSDHKYLLPAN